MKNIKTFEQFQERETKLYRIIIRDTMDTSGANHGVITSLKTRSTKSENEVKKEMEESKFYLDLIKGKHKGRYRVVVEEIFDPISDTVNIKDIRYK